MSGIVHIAGLDIQINNLLRQLCAWCGETLVDYDLARVVSPCGDDCRTTGCQPENHRPATWAVGSLVEVDSSFSGAGRVYQVVEHVDGQQLPDNACERIITEVMA